MSTHSVLNRTMPRPSPHPFALFSLVPVNDRAHAVLAHPNNSHLVSLIPDLKGPKGIECGLNVGFHIGSKSRHTLATLGRNGADIIVEGSSISRIHCSFEIHKDSRLIMLYDRSTAKSTQLYGANAVPFELERDPRRVVVTQSFNKEFGFGGITCDFVRFRIHWHHRSDPLDIQERLSYREDNPYFARTLDETPIVPPSGLVTEINTRGNQEPKIRHRGKWPLGSGSYGQVWKVANVDSGEFLAVKRVKLPKQLQSSAYIMLKREVEALARASHVS